MLAGPPDGQTQWVKYTCVFLAVGIIGFVLITFYSLRIFECSGYGYGPNVYLGQCASKAYGDYEHGALGLQINKRAIDHLERADVVLLGHSHAMVGFSTLATRSYLELKKIRFYNASLSGEYSGFFDFFLSRVLLQARVVVIDVNPFFTGDLMSSTGRFIVENPTRAMIEYRIKRIWQTIHRYTCSSIPRIKSLFCGRAFSIFRSETDGWLIVDYTLAYGSPLPAFPATRAVLTDAEKDLRIKLAREFFIKHQLSKRCVILTAVPTREDFSEAAQAIAEALNVPYVNPVIDGLTLIDGAHMDLPSASIWSNHFWKEASPILERCVAPITESAR